MELEAFAVRFPSFGVRQVSEHVGKHELAMINELSSSGHGIDELRHRIVSPFEPSSTSL